MELVAEMRGKGVPCNVHTYSALMNTCIKCGELDLALDVFKQLKASSHLTEGMVSWMHPVLSTTNGIKEVKLLLPQNQK